MDLLKIVPLWAAKIGYQRAIGRLVTRGVSPSAAEKLCKGLYKSEPKSIREKILDELAKDGFQVPA